MASGPTGDIDFWEFVSCAKCHLPYASEPGQSVPFWLTECGHVICNHHLNPDQSCASCGASGILLVPLHQELDAPMSDWFRSIPSALDLIAYATKFQQEVMARQIRFYRSRHQQIRTVLEKLRSDNSELKRSNESLTLENGQLKRQLGYQGFTSTEAHEPLITTNHNGKRPMDTFPYQYDRPSRRPRTDSSPHHANITPNRLTLPAGRPTPELTHSKEGLQNISPAQPPIRESYHGSAQGSFRPMSRQIGKFAYIPPETSHAVASPLSLTQMVPKSIKASQSSPSVRPDVARTHLQALQPRTNAPQSASLEQQVNRSRIMGPPPLPQDRLGTPAPPSTGTSNRRFVPLQSVTQSHRQSSTSHGPQRFFPSTSESNLTGMSGPWQSDSIQNSSALREPSRHGHG